jgi:hypothetical protein
MKKPAAFAVFVCNVISTAVTANTEELRAVSNESDYDGFKYPVPSNHFPSKQIKADQITCSHHAKVPPERVHPNVVGEFRIADRDVTAHAFGEAPPGEVAKDCCRMDQNMAAVFSMR